MDFAGHFHAEARAFAAAVRRAGGAGGAPPVPSCPGWSVTDLVAHLGAVHRLVAHLIEERLTTPPDPADRSYLALPEHRPGWPASLEDGPHTGPLPAGLADWFSEGAARLEALFRERDPGERVWSWSREQTVGFWLRIQTIEAAVHRWDAERALGAPGPLDGELAAYAVGHALEVMVPARRARTPARPGSGERYRFRRTDGPGVWAVRFDGDEQRVEDGQGPCDVELAGRASDLALFLWQRVPGAALAEVEGERALVERFFELVPPV
ncbi:maleylpyruvate isomerase family mycothiol-dependent enzyme [Streptomyces sp. NPDC052396]|uniref:maleylpyruvate isomerase family mycothiol-dependent enzyme n=1 Tax=Streptomyces sp. NPDC052396 TaxID=3365689 RepID=UPI0037D21F95